MRVAAYLRVLRFVLSLAPTVALVACNGTSGPRPVSSPAAVAPSARVAPAATTRQKRALNIYAATDSTVLASVVVGIPERVYVPNTLAGTVDVIDPASYKIIEHFRVGRSPQHISPSWDLKHLYVNNTSGNTLTVIDPRTSRVVEVIPVADPYNVYFTPDGTK